MRCRPFSLRPTRRHAVLPLCILLGGMSAAVAWIGGGRVARADGAPPAPAPTAPAGAASMPTRAGAPAPHGPALPPPSREFVAACTRGKGQYAARDYAGAAESFRQAMSLRPHDALAPYLLGEALLAQGQPADAEATWTQASADAERDPALHARFLFVLADVAERQKQWDEAKSRWVAYRAFVSQLSEAPVFATTADSRIQVIEKALAQDLAYAPVRQRIADTADGGVFSDPAKSIPPPK